MSQLDQPEANRHPHIRAWFASVPDNALYVSAITIVEAWKGLAAARKHLSDDPIQLREQDRFELAFEKLLSSLSGRIVPIDEQVARSWGRLLGHQDKNRFDACVATTASVQEMIVATRNAADFSQRGVRVLDPFSKRPKIKDPKRR